MFPLCILKTIWVFYWDQKDSQYSDIVGVPVMYMFMMLCALFIMHIYWMCFLTLASISMWKKGKDKNYYDS